MDTVTNVYDLSRALLDDPERDWAHDDYLRPFLWMARRELAMELGSYGLEFYQKVVVLTALPVGTADLGSAINGGALSGLWQPILLEERFSGQDDTAWQQMSRVDALPALPCLGYLQQYEFREGNIYFPATVQSTDLRIRFEELGPALGAEGQALEVTGTAQLLAYGTAALVARSRGNRALALDLAAQAISQRQVLIARAVRQLQSVRRRPRSFNPAF